MSTAQKMTSFSELPEFIKMSHHLRMAVSHDIMQLQNFSVHCNDVDVLKVISLGLRELIKNLNNYENKDKENSSDPMENN